MSTCYAYEIDFVVIQPDCCSVPFMMSKRWVGARQKDHKTFYCPNCGSTRWYPGKSDLEKLQDEVAKANRRIDMERRWRQDADERATALGHQVRAQKAAKTRIKNRIAAGVCPCCNRSFKNLREHMANKHPDYQKRIEA